MKRLLAALLSCGLYATATMSQEAPKLETTLEKFSFAMGYRLARDLAQQGVSRVDAQAMTTGIEHALSGREFPLSREELVEVMASYREMLAKEREVEGSANAEKGRKFLAENKARDGVLELPGGVQYEVHREGSGDKPAESDTVRVHYSGKLLDGSEFDSSYRRGEPTDLGLANVIPGWRTALTAMPVGSKWTVWIPAEQAYGSQGAGARIGPNETLVFEIELIEVVSAEQ